MPTPRRLSVCLCSLSILLASQPAIAQTSQDYDLAIRGATLFDGEVMDGLGDVAVRGDRIVAFGVAPGNARREIDARGLVVAPGFIDLHTHTDLVYQRLGWIPFLGSVHANLNFLTQGVTTVVTGSCGTGFADPAEVAGWLDRVNSMPFGSNVIHLIPHGSLRLIVTGEDHGEHRSSSLTEEELRHMKKLLADGLRAGAWGLSTGLEYDPGARADLAELIELDRVVAQHGGIYASHTRHEGPDPAQMMASYAEAIAVGEAAGTPVQISHIKLSGGTVHGMAAQVVDLVEAARARGVRVTADQYPYTASSTSLSVLAPTELRDGDRVAARYCRGEGRATLRAAIQGTLDSQLPPDRILVSLYPWRWWLQGKTVAEIASERGEDAVETATTLACGWPGLGIYFDQNEADLRALMVREWVATASDGTASNALFGPVLHPRWYGTFPRKIRRYVYEEPVVSLEQALRSMTALPAAIMGLEDRGRLATGYYADIVAFDPKTIRDVATFQASGKYSEGVRYLLVNGALSIDDGKYSGKRAGRSLRRVTNDHPNNS